MSVQTTSPRLAVTLLALNIEGNNGEPNLTWFGINLHVNIGGTVCQDCFHHAHSYTTTEKTSFASKTAFCSVEATYLYSPDTL